MEPDDEEEEVRPSKKKHDYAKDPHHKVSKEIDLTMS